MLQAAKKNKFKATAIIVCLLCVLSLCVAVGAAFINTNRDTRPVPDVTKSSLKYSNAYEELCTIGDYKYLFYEDRDILAIENTKTGYVWKTGVDVPFLNEAWEARDIITDAKESGDNTELKDYAKEKNMTIAEVKEMANCVDSSFNSSQYTAFANSLVTVEYFEGSGDSMTTQRASSAPEKKSQGESQLTKGSSENEWVLDCKFNIDDEELGVKVHMTLGENGKVNFKVPYEEITGCISKIKCIEIAPFLGTSGGILKYYDKDADDFVKTEVKELTPGYVLVPDGSGSLIRFNENKTKFSEYNSKVYGTDPSTESNYYSSLDDVVPLKNPTMPVFGISHGDGTQAAFVAYADQGDEYMSINAAPASTTDGEIAYTYAYASFQYNAEYFQVINQAGDSYRKVQDKPNKFDIDLTYQFLEGDGSDGYKADYTGMAKAYRQHLIDEGILTEKSVDEKNIPIRIDFLMSDSKKGVFSTQEVEVTSASDVKNILNQLNKDGIENINTGLIGWQRGGETLSKPNSTKFSSSVGKKNEFKSLMSEFAKKGIDISFSREFSSINETMVNYYGTAAKHINSQYLSVDKSEVLPKNVPVTEYGYATPAKTAQWITDLYEDLGDLSGSFTIDGASNILLSHYKSDDNKTTVQNTVKLYQDAISKIQKNGTKTNLVNPNKYLWKYTDRYLQSPVGTSQYVYETDTVPFLQMVLNGTMEVYAPYANFSFYAQTDMLRMIDYNISPSFVLTQKPSYLLGSTTSSDYYSTEFGQYEELVNTIYNTVNTPLSQVINYNWDSRTVYSWDGKELTSASKDANGNETDGGIIANQYSKDGDVKTIIINYTSDEIQVNGTSVAANSAAVVEGGVK